MPPHCDSMDGPVVKAAIRALEAEDVDIILAYVPKEGEKEVKEVFQKVEEVRRDGAQMREVADRYFFETVVRIHRAGEGAPYTGLKPAGLDVGPVIPVAEAAIESGSPEQLVQLLSGSLSEEIRQRFGRVMHLKEHAGHGLEHAREYVEAMLGLQVWAHGLHTAMRSGAHEGGHHQH